MVERSLRAGDGDRERTVESLRQHYAEGRLDRGELDERVAAAYTSKTVGELADLVTDLPEESASYVLPVPAETPSRAQLSRQHAARDRVLRAQVGAWVTVSLICWTIWLLYGSGNDYPWPIWVSGPWGAALLGRWVTGRRG